MQQRLSWPAFVVAPSNRLAAAAAQAVTEVPAAYSPLWLHGRSGCGKTHLLHAIASGLASRGLPYRLTDGSVLIEELCTAVRHGQLRAWREALAGEPAILVDDLDALASLPETQRAIGGALST